MEAEKEILERLGALDERTASIQEDVRLLRRDFGGAIARLNKKVIKLSIWLGLIATAVASLVKAGGH